MTEQEQIEDLKVQLKNLYEKNLSEIEFSKNQVAQLEVSEKNLKSEIEHLNSSNEGLVKLVDDKKKEISDSNELALELKSQITTLEDQLFDLNFIIKQNAKTFDSVLTKEQKEQFKGDAINPGTPIEGDEIESTVTNQFVTIGDKMIVDKVVVDGLFASCKKHDKVKMYHDWYKFPVTAILLLLCFFGFSQTTNLNVIRVNNPNGLTLNRTLVYSDNAGYLNSEGGLFLKIRNVSTAYTLTPEDGVVNCTTDTMTQTLPSAVNISGKIYHIKANDVGSTTVNTLLSQTIDGNATKVITTKKTLIVVSDGANRVILSFN